MHDFNTLTRHWLPNVIRLTAPIQPWPDDGGEMPLCLLARLDIKCSREETQLKTQRATSMQYSTDPSVVRITLLAHDPHHHVPALQAETDGQCSVEGKTTRRLKEGQTHIYVEVFLAARGIYSFLLNAQSMSQGQTRVLEEK